MGQSIVVFTLEQINTAIGNAIGDAGSTQMPGVVDDHIVLANDLVVICNATTGSITNTLLSVADAPKRPLTIVKTDSSANKVVLSGAETINGEASYILRAQYESVTIVPDKDGNQWIVINKS